MGGVAKLIERHTVLWELKRRLEDLGGRPGRCMVGGVACGPCLIISREGGSGGGRVARLAGERLGWEVFDRQVLDQIAELAHVRLQLTESVDKQTREKLENHWQPELKPEGVCDRDYLRYLRQVILTLGHHGDAVLVGRGANFLLPSQCALRVRVVAPLEVRAARMAERAGLTLTEAQARIEKFDSERSNFVRTCLQQDAASPLNYDLLLNTNEISYETAADVVVTALRGKLGLGNSLGTSRQKAA